MLRPRTARWFEVLAARDDATLLLHALARTGAVELESRPHAAPLAGLTVLQPLLHQFAEFATRYGAYWPRSGLEPSRWPEAPLATVERCLAGIRSWAADAEPVIQALQRLDGDREQLRRWLPILPALAASAIDLGRLREAGPLVRVALAAFPGEESPDFPGGALVRRLAVDGPAHFLVAATPKDLDSIARSAATVQGDVLEVPDWLAADSAATEARIRCRLAEIAQEETALLARLDAAHRAHDLQRCLADAGRLRWLIDNVRALESGALFCTVTGWCSDSRGERIVDAVERSGARALLHFPAPPDGADPPLTLSNPRWARPFELFTRALGMPAANEADPSPVLAIVVPVMFGYMFGDVGQGLVLAVGGWAWRKRSDVAKLLAWGGVSSTVFGFVFGSFFSVRGIVPAAWCEPLDEPLAVLVVPVVAGAALLAVGLLLGGLAARWSGEFAKWLSSDAGLLAVYAGVLLAFVDARSLWLAAAGALVFCAGRGRAGRRPVDALKATGELVERTLQLLVNTLSFARVGAFALAHAGLSSAVVLLADAAPGAVGRGAVIVAGNAVILTLETMVVSIQTTRLVLFEFFARFLSARGRAFRPLPPPPLVSQEH